MRHEYKNTVLVIVYTSTRDVKEVYGGWIAGLCSTRNSLFSPSGGKLWRKSSLCC